MDKFEVRRLNLRSVLRTHCDDRMATLADKIGRSPSYVSRLLYEEGKNGKKRVGEDMRDIIESALGLERGRLDDETAAVAEQGGKPEDTGGEQGAPRAQPRIAPKARPDNSLFNAIPTSGTSLERLDASEKRILELYRRATRDGKLMIFGAASVAPKEADSGLLDRSE